MRPRRVLNAVLLRPLAWLLLRTDVTGLENAPAQGSFILMVNHCNFLDPAVAMLAMLPRQVVLFTKAENLELPVAGLFFRWYNAIPVRRGEADVRAARAALDLLAADRDVLLIAPEGTRSYHGRLLPAKNGIAFVGTRAGVPILPVGISGVKDFWPNVRHLRRTHVRVRIGHPFRFRGSGRANKNTLNAMTREAMYQLAALLPPEQWGVYADLQNASEEHLEFLPGGRSNLVYATARSAPSQRICPSCLVGAPE